MEILIVCLVILLLWVIYEFNKFIRLKNKIKNSKSSIEVYLNQRFDLIPNLVEVVKGYSKYEADVFSKIAQMRSKYNSEENKDVKKASELNHECNKVFAIAEDNPELKGNEQFMNLQKNLSIIENNLQAARRLYNGDVTLYNTAITSFPGNIIANIFQFKEEVLFEIEEYKKENISIDL